MQANQFTIVSKPMATPLNSSRLLERLSSWVNRIFGCWHQELSRPFTNEGQTYRACLSCGAHRKFNVGRWEMQGGFYYSLPTTRHFRAINSLVPTSTSSLRKAA